MFVQSSYNNYMHGLDKKFLFQVVILLIVVFGSLAYSTGKLPDLPFLPQKIKVTELTIKDAKVTVEIADTTAKRKQGLGDRDSMAQNEGMLFLFPEKDQPLFWMKGLRFPLDMIWIRDNKVIDIIKNAPAPTTGQSDDDLPRYMPKEEVDMVLEVNAGFVDTNKIEIGDSVVVNLPSK